MEKKIMIILILAWTIGLCHICKDVKIPQCHQKPALSQVQMLPPPPRRQKQISIIKPHRYCEEDVQDMYTFTKGSIPSGLWLPPAPLISHKTRRKSLFSPHVGVQRREHQYQHLNNKVSEWDITDTCSQTMWSSAGLWKRTLGMNSKPVGSKREDFSTNTINHWCWNIL